MNGPVAGRLLPSLLPAAALPSLLLAAALLIAGTRGAAADENKARQAYKHGMAEYVLEHWDEAIASFEAGFAEEPQPAFLYNIAQAHRKAGRHADAIRYFEKYLDLAPRAADRAEVERAMREEQALLAREPTKPTAPLAPANVVVPPPAPAVVPVVVPPSAVVVTDDAKPKKKRWPLYVGLGVAAGVLVAGAVVIAVVATTPNDAAVPPTSLGDLTTSFH